MLRSPLGRCFGIGLLLAAIVGLFVLGGADRSFDEAVVGESDAIDEIGLFPDADLDPGAEYRGPEPSTDDSSATESTTTAGVTTNSAAIGMLFAPTDRSEAIRLGGVRFLYVASLLGVALVAFRAVSGWRVDGAELALEPREKRLAGGGRAERYSMPVGEQQSQSGE